MKSYELMPTTENLIETFLNDTIGRNNDVFQFADILDSINGSCSIAVDGNWGSGKTFFIKLTKMILDAYNESVQSISKDNRTSIKTQRNLMCKGQTLPDYQSQVSVYYDAWENDNDEDPVLSLVYTILQSVDSDFSFSNESSCIDRAASILEFFIGRNFKSLIGELRGENPLDSIRNAKKIESEVDGFFNELLAEKATRLVVFIDELDRCMPSYAVKLLERIKHYFSNDKITFVFSVNLVELQHTIKKCYGDNFDGCRYLDRFFDLRISLPPIDDSKFYQSINFSDSSYRFDNVCKAVITSYNFSLREIARYVKLVKIAAYEPTHNRRGDEFSFANDKAIHICLMYIVPIVIGLKIFDLTKYEKFVNGNGFELLEEISYSFGDFLFSKLLDRGESYDDEKKTIVTTQEKLKQVYDALFLTKYSRNIYETKIGELNFDKNTKNIVLRTTSLLSTYTNIEVE